MNKTVDTLYRIRLLACRRLAAVQAGLVSQLRDQHGQGTTEYAILVGVLVVIAIIAIAAFKGSLQNLWTQIQDAINSLG